MESTKTSVSESFTNEELRRCHAIFAEIDPNGVGTVDVEAIFANYDASRNAMVRLLDLNCDKSTGKVQQQQQQQQSHLFFIS
jgi:hypothetical protein